MPDEQSCHMYILRCTDGSLYVGSTENLHERVHTHNTGRGPAFTRTRVPVTLAYSEPFASMSDARQREIQIKKWSRGKKEALIVGDRTALKRLSKRRH